MKLEEIKVLSEAEEVPTSGPVELKDLCARSTPQIATKYIRAMWGKPRLTYQGTPFFGDGETVYDKIERATKHELKELDLEVVVPVADKAGLGLDELRYEAKISDSQEVYLGYSPKSNLLYIGYDAWLHEEDFNEAWDREFEKATGEVFDEENDDHQAMLNSAWKYYQDHTHFGVLLKIDMSMRSADEIVSEQGGFYRAVYRSPVFKNMKLVDLHLD